MFVLFLKRGFHKKTKAIHIICPHVDCRVWQVAADGSQVPLAYRYKVVSDVKVNSFKPKDLQSSDDKLNLRSAQLGAVFNGRFNQLPRASHCDVVWEARGSKHYACGFVFG